MIIVGQVSTVEEAKEITFMAKVMVIGQRAQHLGRQA
jgi:hypothetical protein